MLAQDYPKELLDIFVVADNCTDDTAFAARALGATVFERSDTQKAGKGYALDHAFKQICSLRGEDYYEGYLVFDADNVLDEKFVSEINKVFDAGYRVVTSYRNSKNFGYNWISAGYGLWFLREASYLNGSRMLIGTSCAVSGTGFLVSSDIIKKDNGFKYHLLTEDIEFTVDKVLGGEVIGYCEKAVLYDEQPVRFKASWDQRMRWTRGFYQIMRRYGIKLIRGCFRGRRFQCFDMYVTIAPAALLSLSILFLNFGFIIYGIIVLRASVLIAALWQIAVSLCNFYSSMFLFGLITLITEWKKIFCSRFKKVAYLFTFPVFLFTYVPITVAALFNGSALWKPTRHTFAQSVADVRGRGACASPSSKIRG